MNAVAFGVVVGLTAGNLLAAPLLRRHTERHLHGLYQAHDARCRARDAATRRQLIGYYRAARDAGFQLHPSAVAHLQHLVDLDRAEMLATVAELERQLR